METFRGLFYVGQYHFFPMRYKVVEDLSTQQVKSLILVRIFVASCGWHSDITWHFFQIFFGFGPTFWAADLVADSLRHFHYVLGTLEEVTCFLILVASSTRHLVGTREFYIFAYFWFWPNFRLFYFVRHLKLSWLKVLNDTFPLCARCIKRCVTYFFFGITYILYLAFKTFFNMFPVISSICLPIDSHHFINLLARHINVLLRPQIIFQPDRCNGKVK